MTKSAAAGESGHRNYAVSGALAAVLLCAVVPALADTAVESERLAALSRQLELLDRLAAQSAANAPGERARYHFDYPRLRDDIRRVRAGVRDYLTPQRAQPRDPVELAGDYRREAAAEDMP